MCVLIGLCYAMITFLTPKGQSVNIQFIMLSMLSLYTLNTLIHWLKTSLYINIFMYIYGLTDIHKRVYFYNVWVKDKMVCG